MHVVALLRAGEGIRSTIDVRSLTVGPPRRRVGVAAKLSMAKERPIRHKTGPTRLRMVIKPDLEEGFFFIVVSLEIFVAP